MQKVLSFKFNQTPFVYFCFYFFCLKRQIQKLLLWYISMSYVLLMLSCRNLNISGLIRVYFIYLNWFLYVILENVLNLIVLHVAVLFPQHRLLKRLSFLHCIFLPPLLYVDWPEALGFIPGTLFCCIETSAFCSYFFVIMQAWE